ncbi:hypothetical protein [Hyphobacterium marinum]|uniref:Uncharacterized protein n=1 Tax=Hyphobacterium marinum TaxID=3116574 RepID=A0ABU7LY20_9PROT|nr:hypothetical protein [Hyphobacterium sp. Y6023]MEE2566459.1 hypothetical protein [Hyphobacterium sp. Y6023]
MTRRKTIAILYHARGTYPLRTAVETHLHAWLRHSRHHTAHVNAALCDPVAALNALDPDVVVIHTSFCGLRWNRSEFSRLEPAFDRIGRMRALKIALPQDEYYLVNALRSMLSRMQAGVILSCAEPENWARLYGGLVDTAQFRTVLTGYLDERVVEKARLWGKPLKDRDIFVSYRAWDTGFWLGEHGAHKVRVGEAMRSALEHRNIPSNISMIASDTIAGERWLKFLGNSRATIGVEGGASLIDADGSIKACVDGFIDENPDATLEDVRTACFPEGEGDFKLACLSPRHLEAIATGTAQALVRGQYNGILEAGRHYVAIEPDYSNLDSVIDTLKDDAAISEMIDAARRDIVESGRYTYRAFVGEIDTAYVDPLPDPDSSRGFARLKAAIRDWINWRIIQGECFYLEHPGLFRPFAWLLRPIYCRLVPSSRA